MTRTITKPFVVLAATIMVAVLLAGTASPASADPVDGTGAVVSATVQEYSSYWSASLVLDGSFALAGQTYSFSGQMAAYNNSSMGSSGSGYWYFSGSLISQDSAVTGSVGVALSSSAPMTYTRTELVPGALYSMEMRLNGPATAYLPDGRSVGFIVDFVLDGQFSKNPLEQFCGYSGCSYYGTYSEVASPSGPAPHAGTGALISATMQEYSYSWRASMVVEGSFVLAGRSYSFSGPIEAYNNCCSSMGSSGSGYWHFSGSLISQDSVVNGYVGVAVSSSASMTYTRTELVPGALYSMEMRLSGPATAYLPDGRSVSFNVSFALGGQFSKNPLEEFCGYSGCSYYGTYNQHDSPAVVAASATGGATSSEVTVGWGDSTAHGGSVCVSATGDCYGAAGGVGVCPFGRC